jgi:DNA repair protein RecO (recombination protein O)
MDWTDEGIVLSARRHGETDVILQAMTFEHGRHAGLVKGGAGRTARPLLQPGNVLELTWRARLAEHLGTFRAEPQRLLSAALLEDATRLAALSSACGLVEALLPERDPHPRVYAALLTWLERLAGDADWPIDYVRLELLLLADLGFGLELEACAVTGETTDLAFVSPRTGRAVSRRAAGDLAGRLLPLPGFLVGEPDSDPTAVLAGLRLSGHFLRRFVFEPADRMLPASRERLLALLQPDDDLSVAS